MEGITTQINDRGWEMINGMIGYVRGHRRIDWSSYLCAYAKSLRIVTMAYVRMNGTPYLNHC